MIRRGSFDAVKLMPLASPPSAIGLHQPTRADDRTSRHVDARNRDKPAAPPARLEAGLSASTSRLVGAAGP